MAAHPARLLAARYPCSKISAPTASTQGGISKPLTIRKDNGPENLALLRRLALSLAKLEGSKGSMKGKLKKAGWDNAFLTRLLTQFANAQMR